MVAGPRDIRDLPEFFGEKATNTSDYGDFQIEILAEINHAQQLTPELLLQTAKQLVADGANVIDLGCSPGVPWRALRDAVLMLRAENIRVSIDTFEPSEARVAVEAGAELVLSVNATNRQSAIDWGAEVVVVPDDLVRFEESILETVNFLEKYSVPFRIDPILEPIGCGFANSIHRYYHMRKIFPDAPMMMGIGNLTELTDCDSAGINMSLIGLCEELQIRSVLTTQVINWARSSVKECDIARRMATYAVRHGVPPKRLEKRLVQLRDPRLTEYPAEIIHGIASDIRDNNYRILVSNNAIHLISSGVHIVGTDPFKMMAELLEQPQSDNIDPSHAFYLGFELSKALTALTLHKQYDQDVALTWGHLTRPEKHFRIPRQSRHATSRSKTNRTQ